MRFRSRRFRVPAVAVCATLAAPAAAAHATTVEVVDAQGRPQVAALTAPTGERWWTGPDGRAEVPGAPALTVSRAPGDGCGGAEGVAVNAGLASARVVVAPIVREGARPALDAEERRMLELVTAYRQRLGRRTRHADALDRTADWYAATLARAGWIDHCLVRSPTARAHATGFPGAAVGEALAVGGPDTAASIFARWLASPPHRATIEAHDPATFGVAHVGGTWALLTSGDCGTAGVIPSPVHGLHGASCGWSEPGASSLDGDGAALADGDGAASQTPAGATQPAAGRPTADPRLRVTLRRRGRRVKVVAGVAAAANGRIKLTVAGRARYVKVGTRKLRATLRLRPGRYAVAVDFSGTGPWRSARAATAIRVR